jgi:hypothetical protein
VDRGARYIEAQGRLLAPWVDAMHRRGVVRPWSETGYVWKSGAGIVPVSVSHPRYVAPDGINAIAKWIGADLDIWRDRRVVRIMPISGNRWHLEWQANPRSPEGSLELTANAIILAIPAPQAVELLLPLVESGLSLEFLHKARSVQFDPCITVTAGYSPSRWSELHQRNPPWNAVEFPNDAVLNWVGFDSSKRAKSEQPFFMMNSSAELAQNYLDATDLQPAGDRILARAADCLFPWLDAPEFVQIHRWRYALVRQGWDKDTLATAEPLPLVCCGDWCGKQEGIEAALRSGLAASSVVNAQLQQRPIPPIGEVLEVKKGN